MAEIIKDGDDTVGRIEPFRIAIDPSQIDDLKTRLARTRLPAAMPGTGWSVGIDIEFLKPLLDYWRVDYDWAAAETALNRHPQFRTTIDGVGVHFLHIRSSRETATPLLLVHGWPGSFVEFLDVIGPLTEPVGPDDQAFHLVIPSLPGFGLSDAPQERGWGPPRIGRAFAALMQRLGYYRYGVQGGDWGAIVVAEMALVDEGHIIGLHTNMPLCAAPSTMTPLSESEQADVAAMQAFTREGQGYSMIQGTRPQTLAVGLSDSPAGLCAWIAEKFYAWSDHDGDLFAVIDRDTLLTNVMLYWLTGTVNSSARLYHEFYQAHPVWTKGRIVVPAGILRCPREMARPPRAWIEQQYNVVHWTVAPRGGHFAALERPALFAKDVSDFFGGLRV